MCPEPSPAVTPHDETTVRREAVAQELYEHDAEVGDMSSSDWEDAGRMGLQAGYFEIADRILSLLGVAAPLGEQGSTAAVREEVGGEPVEYPLGRCAGCGEVVRADHGALGHTRAEHSHHCDPDRGCVGECPVPVACGPVHPFAAATPPHAQPNERAGSSEMTEEPGPLIQACRAYLLARDAQLAHQRTHEGDDVALVDATRTAYDALVDASPIGRARPVPPAVRSEPQAEIEALRRALADADSDLSWALARYAPPDEQERLRTTVAKLRALAAHGTPEGGRDDG
jgi:hypothetical protein